jgi:nucleotide-binding universal stress UspA family protein
MFHRIVAAYNESPESQRALETAIRLAASLHAELHTVTAVDALPAYTAFAAVADPSLPRELKQDRLQLYEELQEKARVQVQVHGIELQNHLVEGQPVDAIIQFLRRQKADLVVIGLHPHDLHISRLWSKVFELAQDAPCSVLGVH